MPLEPLYSLEVAAELIPCTLDVLRHILSRNPEKFPARFHTQHEPRKRNGVIVDYEGGRALRMLLESECLAIREMVISPIRGRLRPRYAAPNGHYRSEEASFQKFLGIEEIVR